MFDGGHGGCDNGSSDGCWGNHCPLNEVEGISSTEPLRVGLSISLALDQMSRHRWAVAEISISCYGFEAELIKMPSTYVEVTSLQICSYSMFWCSTSMVLQTCSVLGVHCWTAITSCSIRQLGACLSKGAPTKGVWGAPRAVAARHEAVTMNW